MSEARHFNALQILCAYWCWQVLHPFNGLFSRTTRVGRHQKDKPIWILLEQDMGGSGIRWTMCKSLAPRSRQITTPATHHTYTMTINKLFVFCLYLNLNPCPPVDILQTVITAPKLRGKIRTVLCCIVYNNCAQWYAHTHISSFYSRLLV